MEFSTVLKILPTILNYPPVDFVCGSGILYPRKSVADECLPHIHFLFIGNLNSLGGSLAL